MVKGVLLDIDGTLVASNEIHTHAWKDAFQKFGYEIPFDKIRPLIGMGADNLLPTLIPNLNQEEDLGKKVTEERKKILIGKYSSKLEPTKGARELIWRLKKLSFKLIVATSASEDELQVLLQAADVDDLLNHFTTASDVENSKPAPDIISVALNKIALPPEEVIMLGDTPYDIESATKCNVPVIAFRSGGFPEEKLKNALMIFDDPADLLAHFEQTPFI